MGAARSEIRTSFDGAREITDVEQRAKLEHAQQVAKVLRVNVVQGRRVERSLGQRGREEGQGKGHAEAEAEGGTYALRIHSETELGDNDSIRKAKAKDLPKDALKSNLAGAKVGRWSR